MTSALQCEEIGARFAALSSCEPTDQGLRFPTHCLYPSFEPVFVFVVRFGEGAIVHDGGGGARCAWLHSRDDRGINQALSKQAALHHLTVKDESLLIEVKSLDWLPSAIMAVANASATAAREAAESSQQVAEATLKEMVRTVLIKTLPNPNKSLASDYPMRGRSGKEHKFDFAVLQGEALTLIDTVAPHHVSVNSRYVAFSDMAGVSPTLLRGMAVHDRPLDPEDVSLLTQYADVVPYRALQPSLETRLHLRLQ